jgi:SAM-dependent methyltransferase
VTSAVLEALYRTHPVRAATVLRRLHEQDPTDRPPTALDLGTDSRTLITDQNHVGGARFVVDLARAASVTRRSCVLDLGAGTGGSARVLAHVFGCRVDGLDISRDRVRDATTLTRLAGLQRVVRVRHADAMRAAVPRRRYDVIWGQSAWAHIADKQTLLRRWRPALKEGGRIAFEESYLKREPTNSRERALLAQLQRDWLSTLISREQWEGLLASAAVSATIVVRRHLTRSMRAEALKLRYRVSFASKPGRRSQSVPSHPRMTPFSPHSGHCHRMSDEPGCSSAMMSPRQRLRPGRRQHGTFV